MGKAQVLMRVIGLVGLIFAVATCSQSKQPEPARTSPVPLTKWHPEEAKLLGEEPVTRADLPAEWQELPDSQLGELLTDTAEKAAKYRAGFPKPGMNCDHEASLRFGVQMRYLALVLDVTPRKISSLYEISDNLRRLWRLDEAIRFAQAGVRESEAADESQIVASAELYKLLGWKYTAISEYDKAFECFRKAFDVYGTWGDTTGLVNTDYALADLYYKLGLTDEALERFNQCLAMLREYGNSAYEGMTLGSIGSIYYDRGKYEIALEHLKSSVKILRELPPRYWRGLGESLAKIGDVYRRFEKYDEGVEYCKEAVHVLQESNFRRRESLVTTTLGDLYRDSGQLDKALKCYDDAIIIAVEISASMEYAHTLLQRAKLRYESDEIASAKQDLQEAFSVYLTQATQFTWESGLKGSLTESLHNVGSLLAELQIKLGKPEQALQTVESFKSAPLLQLLAQAKRCVRDPHVEQALCEYRTANAYLQTLRERLCELLNETGENATVTEERSRLIRQIEEHTRKADNTWALIQKQNPRFAEILQVKGLSASDIRRNVLRHNQVLLEYLLTDRYLIAFVLPKSGKLNVVVANLPDLCGDHPVDEWISRNVAMLYDPRETKYTEAGRVLYDLLLAPVSQALREGSHLIICPDGALFSVPFDALIDPYGVPVLNRHSIGYSSSATMLSYAGTGRTNRDKLVAGVSFGKIEMYGEEEFEVYGEPASVLTSRDLLTPLPGVHQELKSVGKILGVAPQTDAVVTEEWLKESLPGKRVVHLATHGRLSSIPLLNGLYTYRQDDLKGAAEPREIPIGEDGFLSMCEVMGIPMDGCELIVLSCCHSFEGDLSAGQGMMGVSQGFLYAGVSTVIASLAQVNDDATRELIVEFYKNWWERGLSKSDALRAAKQSLAHSERFSDPRFWAPFVLYGLE